MKLPIYLDYMATTPIDPRVVEKMIPYMTEFQGNAASSSHAFGWKAKEAVENARQQVADLIGADPKEIVWTSGATESNNLAIKGAAHFYSKKGRHIITMQTEHKAVIDTCRKLEHQGFEVTYLAPETNGLLDLEKLKQAIRADTILVSIMSVNNEIGTIQDIEAIGRICREHSVIFHCDAAQAIGKVPIDLTKLPVDLMTMTAHKLYGPKGVGALYVRRKPKVRIEAQIHGGGHERGMRSGTLPVHQIVGMGEAFHLAKLEMNKDNERLRRLQQKLYHGLQAIEEVTFNGIMDPKYRIPHNINTSFAFIEGESLMMAIKDIAVSSGSACTSASLEPSYVLKALGCSDILAHSSIRFSMGRFSTEEEIDYTINLVKEQVQKLRDMSPLWEMHKEGVDINAIQWADH